LWKGEDRVGKISLLLQLISHAERSAVSVSSS
jgi:hypothetical protein